MAPGTEYSPQTNGIDGGSMKETSVLAMEDQNNNNNNDNDDESLGGLASTNMRKPPRNLFVMRHCTSSTFLAESVSIINTPFYFSFFFFKKLLSWSNSLIALKSLQFDFKCYSSVILYQ